MSEGIGAGSRAQQGGGGEGEEKRQPKRLGQRIKQICSRRFLAVSPLAG